MYNSWDRRKISRPYNILVGKSIGSVLLEDLFADGRIILK
jgi:hypothetical protein